MRSVVLPSALAGVFLRRLHVSDAPALHQLLSENKAHLTAYGDYLTQGNAEIADIEAELLLSPDLNWRFGIFLGNVLVGRVDLIGVEPPRYGLGYWLAANHLGKGLATEAVRLVLAFAAQELSATDVFAGVTLRNVRSAKLLERLGFRSVAQFDTYTRYHLVLD